MSNTNGTATDVKKSAGEHPNLETSDLGFRTGLKTNEGLLNFEAHPEKVLLSENLRSSISTLPLVDLLAGGPTATKLRLIHSIVLAHKEIGAPQVKLDLEEKDVQAIAKLSDPNFYQQLRDIAAKSLPQEELSQAALRKTCQLIKDALTWQVGRLESLRIEKRQVA